MRYKRANFDSLNLSDNHLEAIFIHHEDYSIETVKSTAIFEPEIWSKTFGKSLTQNIIDAKIIDSYRGSKLPLKTFAVSPLSQTLEFAGLHGYNDRSKQLMITLNELKSQLQQTRVTRIDIAIDYERDIPKRIVKAISKTREPFRYGNTTYYKTAKEKKTNQKMDIKIYNKAHKAKLDYPLKRLEFVFKGSYFNKLLLKDLDLAIKKMEKSIKKAIGSTVKIEGI